LLYRRSDRLRGIAGRGIDPRRGRMSSRPAVSRALRQIEDCWVRAGFPGGADLDSIVADVVASSR